MEKVIIHLSDIHYRLNWEENQGVVLNAFWKDLGIQVSEIDKKNIYVVFSGDLVQAGGTITLYNHFLETFDSELTKLGIQKENRICVPGNHDISQEYIKNNDMEHDSIVNRNFSETDFNNYINRIPAPNLLTQKFNNYISFQEKFAHYGLKIDNLTGNGFIIDDDLAIYCLNTALCSSGGFQNIEDQGKLCIDTRTLYKWIETNHSKNKVLIMHHNINLLSEWAKKELHTILQKEFILSLSGHTHEQEIYHSIYQDTNLIECSAPPLFTNKNEELGYTIISINKLGVSEIKYRQWTKRKTFVSGVNFSDTDDGCIRFNFDNKQPTLENDFILDLFNTRLEEALRTYSHQPIAWIDRVLSKNSEVSSGQEEKDSYFNIDDLINKPFDLIIKAPAQFGLTCLALYLTRKAWEQNKEFWLYIDCKMLRLQDVDRAVEKELSTMHQKNEKIRCIVLDSWRLFEKTSVKIIKKIKNKYPNIPVVIMQTTDEATLLSSSKGNDDENESFEFDFETLYLLALQRKDVRKLVALYNNEKSIGEEEVVMAKVVSDLDVLNIHRTPLNCFTLLTVLEKYFNESPVNRTIMLEKVLFLLFDMGNVPTYKSKLDVKDCEYVLGVFCERMIKNDAYYFSREDFIKDIKLFCVNKLIEVDIDLLFDILFSNNIIAKYENLYSFRFAYWIFYFAAQRMHHNKDFTDYIFSSNKYANFPEIIEFYTGIDRNRSDALVILTKDINETCDIVQSKVGLPENMNPFKYLSWRPDSESLDKMQTELNENVQNSKLPKDIKDQYADNTYDPGKPYYQRINNILHEYSVVILMQDIKAASRALRNSDYVDPEIKIKLFQGITRAWEQLSRVLLALTPMLAIKGNAGFEGAGFILYGNFGDTIEKRFNEVLTNIPYNITLWFKDDLFSNKVSPLLYDQLNSETNEFIKHSIALLIILERPRNWKTKILNYIN